MRYNPRLSTCKADGRLHILHWAPIDYGTFHGLLMVAPSRTPPVLENIYCTPDALGDILTHVYVMSKVEGRDRVANCCATGQEARKGIPIATAQSVTGYRDGTQSMENILEDVGFESIWFYEPRGQVHIFKV